MMLAPDAASGKMILDDEIDLPPIWKLFGGQILCPLFNQTPKQVVDSASREGMSVIFDRDVENLMKARVGMGWMMASGTPVALQKIDPRADRFDLRHRACPAATGIALLMLLTKWDHANVRHLTGGAHLSFLGNASRGIPNVVVRTNSMNSIHVFTTPPQGAGEPRYLELTCHPESLAA